MAVIEVSIVPLGTESTSLSPYVAACTKCLSTRVPGGSVIRPGLTSAGVI